MNHPISRDVGLFGGLVLAWVFALFVFFLDHLQGGAYFPSGLLTVVAECVLELSAILSWFKARDEKKYEVTYLIYCLCFIMPADLSYLVVHYVLKMENGALTFMVTTLPYSVAYVFGSLGMWRFLREKGPLLVKENVLTLTWLPLLFSIPVLFTILLPLMISYFSSDGWNFLLFELVFNSVFAMTFFFISVVAFGFSIDRFFSFFALGGILIQLGNWGIYSALLKGDQYSLTEYEFLWLCGIVTLWYGVVFVRRVKSDKSGLFEVEVRPYRRSLIIQQRQIVIGLVSVTILIAVALLGKNAWSYRIAFFGVGIGCFLSLLLGELLAMQIVHYSALFGEVVKKTATDQAVDLKRSEFPVELWQIYQIAFKGEMIQHKISVAVRESIGKLASQVAHDGNAHRSVEFCG